MAWTALFAAFLLTYPMGVSSVYAEDLLTIKQLQSDPESYHAKTVTLRGTILQIHQYRDGYTFILSDDTGFLQVQSSPVWMTEKGVLSSHPFLSDGEKVEIQAYVTVSVKLGKTPGSETLERAIRVAAGTVRKLRD